MFCYLAHSPEHALLHLGDNGILHHRKPDIKSPKYYWIRLYGKGHIEILGMHLARLHGSYPKRQLTKPVDYGRTMPSALRLRQTLG